MHHWIKSGLSICWAVILLVWIVSTFRTKKSRHREKWFTRILLYWLPLIIGVLLMGPGEWFGHSLIREPFVPHSDLVGIIGLSLAVIGTLLAIWSRYLLGRNWSISVELKKQHELVTAGPYRYIRHPIYTGLLLLFAGNALICGDWRAIIGFALIFISIWLKLKKEEQWLNTHFGTQYELYQRQTKALMPWII